MLRYTSKNTNNIFTQSIVELCECCGRVEGTVHVSEVTTKPDHLRDLTFKIKDAADSDYTLKLRKDRVEEIQVARMADGMVSASGGTTESLRYELRSERMCSSSNGTSVEYCYRVVNNAATESFKAAPRAVEFKANFETKFRDKSDEEPAGYKIGMDREGNPVRIQSETYTTTNPNGETITETKYFGAHEKEWYRELSDADKLLTITASLTKEESTKIEDYDYKESFEADTTSSYYTNDTSIIFDGANDYIKLTGTGGAGGFHYTAEEFDEHGVTISAWVYMTASGSSGHPVISIGRSNNKYYGYQMRITSDFRIAMDYYGLYEEGAGQTSNHRKTVVQSNSVIPTKLFENTWMQFTCVYGTSNTEDWRIYMNGAQMTTLTSGNEEVVLTYNGNDGNIGRLGKSNQGAETWFAGYINHIGLWAVALEPASVAGLYNDGSPPYLLSGSAKYVETGSRQLMGYWELGEGEGDTTRNIGYFTRGGTGTLYNIEEEEQEEGISGWTSVSPLIGDIE